MSDADSENSETIVWIDFSLACQYITPDKYKLLISQVEEIGRLLHNALHYPEKYINLK
jgi:four helix bundle protein